MRATEEAGLRPAVTHATVAGPTLLAVMLAGLAMLGPFSVDTYLPAFPQMQEALQATPMAVQQTLTAYMFSFALMMLLYGALSDTFGRRNLILWSLVAYVLASLGCAATNSVEMLWAFRILQGLSAGAGVVIGRAIIRDRYAGAQAERLLSLVMMIFSIAPAIAPIIGGWIVKLLDWRSIFIFLSGYTVLLLWLCYARLPETLPSDKRQAFNTQALADAYKQIFRSSQFHLLAGVIAFTFVGMFLYVAAAPVFLTQHLGLGPDEFGWQFVPNVAGTFVGSFIANRLAGKMSISKQVVIGMCLLMGASLFNVVYHAFYPPTVFWSIAPLFFYTTGMGMVMPGTTLLVLDLFPRTRGTAASCQSFAMTMLSALVAGIAAPILSRSALWLAVGQLVIALIALGMWFGSDAGRAAPESKSRGAGE
jgi:DHA1 family bicyclomycin/chloramphenicol resistance-like MFS transporter